jgi:thioredoxin-related protein
MKVVVGIATAAFVFAIAASPVYGQSQATTASTSHERVKFDPKRDPAKDLSAAIGKAKKENKRIILDVGGEWCGWCKLLDKYFVEKQDIGRYLHDNYVVVKVNFSPENENKAFLGAYPKIEGYPHFFVLEKDGKFLHSQNTGELEEGQGYSDEKMMAFLKKWAPKKSD